MSRTILQQSRAALLELGARYYDSCWELLAALDEELAKPEHDPHVDEPPRDDLYNALAEIRALFPTPAPGGYGEREFMEAVSDPLAVPAYVKTMLSAPQSDKANPWRDAVEDQLVVAHILNETHSDPRKAVSDAIDWNVQVALDPQVSSDAQALIDRGRALAQLHVVKVTEHTKPPRTDAEKAELQKVLGEVFGWAKPERAQPEQEPVALKTVYETIIQWDEGGGKRSRRELARRITALYTAPEQCQPLTEEQRGELRVAAQELSVFNPHLAWGDVLIIATEVKHGSGSRHEASTHPGRHGRHL